MGGFDYQNEVLCVDGVPIPSIVTKTGTPVYIYSANHFRQQYKRLNDSLGHENKQICYSVKANSNLKVLDLFRSLGAGFDIVSGGELQRVMAIGCDPNLVIFSGVGKLREEIDLGLKTGIGCFNVESEGELTRIIEQATLLGKEAPISIRVNPNIDPKTHPYISTGLKENKFGVSVDKALDLYQKAKKEPHLRIVGIDCHIGSQILDIGPLKESLANLMELAKTLKYNGIDLTHVDLGGGIGVQYGDEKPFDLSAYGSVIAEHLAKTDLKLILEPGRFLVANGGTLITRVEYLKETGPSQGKNFAIVDGAMTDLIRPSLYNAWHEVKNVSQRGVKAPNKQRWDIVGPVCESGDFLAKDRNLFLKENDLLAIMSAGAYGIGLSSNYNTRPRPAEVMVDDGSFEIIRRRENTRDQLRLETFSKENG